MSEQLPPMAPPPNARARWLSSRYLAPVALAMAALVLAINEFGYFSVERLVKNNTVVLEARALSDQLQESALVMESAAHGYMLTGRDAYLEPYTAASRQFEPLQTQMQALAQRYPKQRENLEALVEAARRKRSEMVEVLQRFQSGNRAGAMDLTLTEIGRENMVRLNQIANEIKAEEAEAFASGRKLGSQMRFWSRIGITGLVLLFVAAVFALLRARRDHELERERFLTQLSAERDTLAQQVDRRTGELTDLALHLQRVREDERGHLARELHDELGGLLTAAKLDVARVRKRVDGSGPEVAERLQHLTQTLDTGIALKRRIIEDLRPSSLGNLGLQRTLEIQCAEFAQRSETRVNAVIADLKLDPERALTVYRVLQEALTNIAKYAQASEVNVQLQRMGEKAQLRVQDNGRGFDPQQVREGRHGLTGMRFRMRSCGGDLLVRSAPGQGTTIEATLPMTPA